MPGSSQPSPDPQRFEVAGKTLFFDRFMGWFIRFGGIAVILAVIGIFLFIAKEVVPLFQSPEVEESGTIAIQQAPPVLGVDEWGEMPFFYTGGEAVTFVNFEDDQVKSLPVPGLEGLLPTAYAFDTVHQRVVFGLADGRVGSFLVRYLRQFNDDLSDSWLEPEIVAEPIFQVQHGEGPVTSVSYGDASDPEDPNGARLIVVKRGQGADSTVSVLKLMMKKGLIGAAKLTLLGQSDLTSELSGVPSFVRASSNGSMILVGCQGGGIDYFARDLLEVNKVQTFQPFAAQVPRQVDLLYGGVSLILTSQEGRQEQWSLFRETEEAARTFGLVKTFPDLPRGPVVFSNSLRNRSFLAGAGRYLSLRYSTSGDVRWEQEVAYRPVAGIIDGKSRHLIVAGDDGAVHRYLVEDPHPEASVRAFFGKVWYEGGAEAKFQWQSTGGSSDFEPKLSLMPLIFGSLKGTFYALLFSIPVALLAAVFSAAFLPLSVKRVIKPMMEIMASLPSVVLGFLAAFWLAPVLQYRVPSVLLLLLLVPSSVFLVGYAWSTLPVALRNRFHGGQEWMLVLPVMALFGWLGWILGPVLEGWLFVYTDPQTGQRIADFTMWWPQATGLDFQQRNSLVVGFMMGFAVIPVIFTIAEDALSNVPKSLTAASAALGANRWQVVWTIMLPVASSGIFSALMIGFGRAVGETMILVMAAGGTPLMEGNIFNGMRTLAANIAIELPEAAVGSTHYRTLFLSAVVLFLLTSVMNTIAEVLRQRLRERNQIV
ncbi:MAG: ABC transporter permease subunit [Verrucomicrobiota bacterium]